MSFLCAVATVAGLGIVAAMMSMIWADWSPAADVRRLMSGADWLVDCLRVLETILSHAGCKGIFVVGGFWNKLLAWDSEL